MWGLAVSFSNPVTAFITAGVCVVGYVVTKSYIDAQDSNNGRVDHARQSASRTVQTEKDAVQHRVQERVDDATEKLEKEEEKTRQMKEQLLAHAKRSLKK